MSIAAEYIEEGPAMMPALSAVIVDDQRLFGEAVRRLLERGGFEVLAVAPTAAEGIAVARAKRPDVILVDLGLPGGNAQMLIRTLRRDVPGTKVLVLSARTDPQAVSESLRSGAHGYVTKDTQMPRLIHSIHAALSGKNIDQM